MHIGAILLLSLAVVGGVSVVGLLQSTERVGTSGIITQLPPSPPSPPAPPPPEPAVEIDVYSDLACTSLLSSIDWGSIEAGDSVQRTAYVKNNGDQSVTLSLSTDNWVPSGAASDMTLSWNYDGSALDPGAVAEVTLTLSVDSGISGVDDFSFDVVVIGSAS